MAFGLRRRERARVTAAPANGAARLSPAESLFQRLVLQIVEFETALANDEEVLLRIVQAPDFSLMHVEDLGFHAPDMLIFHGYNEHGRPIRLLQHYAQVNMMLTASPRLDAPARRIGFHLTRKAQL